MKVPVRVQVELPDGTTHFSGNISDDPGCYKCKQIAGYNHWFFYDTITSQWVLSGLSEPTFIKSVVQGMVAELPEIQSDPEGYWF